jgi:hypothetical protein
MAVGAFYAVRYIIEPLKYSRELRLTCLFSFLKASMALPAPRHLWADSSLSGNSRFRTCIYRSPFHRRNGWRWARGTLGRSTLGPFICPRIESSFQESYLTFQISLLMDNPVDNSNWSGQQSRRGVVRPFFAREAAATESIISFSSGSRNPAALGIFTLFKSSLRRSLGCWKPLLFWKGLGRASVACGMLAPFAGASTADVLLF